MAKITYLDPTDDAPKIEWMGQKFRANVPVEVSDRELLEKASTHPYFKVEEDKAPKEKDPPKVPLGRPPDAKRDQGGRFAPEQD